MLSPHLFPMCYIHSYIHPFYLYGGPKYVGSKVCTESLRMYVGYTNSFSICFFCTIEFLCMLVEQNIHNVNILLTSAYNRNEDKTSTFMDGGPSNRGRGPDLTACLVGLRSHSQLHWGSCLTRMGPKYVGSSVCTESLGLRSHSRLHRGHCSTWTGLKYVGSLVCTESLRMYVEYTNAFSIRFFVNTYDTVHIVLIKIHIVFTIAYNTY